MASPRASFAHRLLWSIAAAVVLVLGGLGLLATTSPVNVVAWVLVGAFVGGGGYWMRVHAPSPVPVKVRRDLLGRAAAVTSLSLLVLVGLMGVGGASGALLLGLLLATSPPVTAWLRSCVARQPRVSAVPADDAAPTAPAPAVAPRRVTCPPADGLTTAELCQAWRVSFTALDTVDRPEERAQVVQRRQEYLDALERRDPHGFARWIGLGARAASDPGRYLDRDTDVEPPAA